MALALCRNQAHTRYWLWMAASLKFVVPFSLLVCIGDRMPWKTAAIAIPEPVSFAMDEIG
jgi:bla regulator protein BlaR1